MTPQAVASAPRDQAPPRPAPQAAADGDFAQLVAGADPDKGASPAASDQAASDQNDPARAQDGGNIKAGSGADGAATPAAAAAAPASPPAIPAPASSRNPQKVGPTLPSDAASIASRQSPAASAAPATAPAALPGSADNPQQLWHHTGETAGSATVPPSPGSPADGAGADGNLAPTVAAPPSAAAASHGGSGPSGPAPTLAAAKTASAKTKNNGSVTGAALSAVVASTIVPALLPQTLRAAVAAATPTGGTQAATPPPLSVTPFVVAQVPGAGAAPNTARSGTPGTRGTAAPNAASAAGGTSLPADAAALNARVVAGAPNLVSQPDSALAGLWHHVGDTAPAATGLPAPGNAAGTAAAAGDPGNAAQDAAPGQIGAASHDGVAAAPQVVPGVDSAVSSDDLARDSDAAAPDGSAPSGAIAASLPGTASTPTASTAAPTANAAPPLPVVIPAVAQVAVNLAQAVQNGTDRIEIQLKPSNLGTIDVKLDLTRDGKITAAISADRADTLNLLRQNSGELQQALRDAGLQADSGSLSFNLRSDPQAFAQNATPTRRDIGTAATPSTAAAAQTASARSRYHAGTLDIEV